jgi:hypothetical protein
MFACLNLVYDPVKDAGKLGWPKRWRPETFLATPNRWQPPTTVFHGLATK